MVKTIENRKTTGLAINNQPPHNDDTSEPSPQYCENTNDNEISSVACTSAQTNESPPTKKRKHTKRCRICKTTEGVIVSNACHMHLDQMRIKNNEQRTIYNK